MTEAFGSSSGSSGPPYPPILDRRDKQGWRQVRIEQVVQESADAVSLYFSMQDGQPLGYQAGQYLMCRFAMGGSELTRAYSLSSSPLETVSAITIKRTFNGRVSKLAVEQLSVGMQFEVSAPEGLFVLPAQHDDSDLLFVAGGSGITPVYSMLKTLLQGDADQRRLCLLFYARQSADFLFADALTALAEQHSRLQIEWIITEPDPAWSGRVEKVCVKRVLALAGALHQPRYWLCGSEGLVNTLYQGLAAESQAMQGRNPHDCIRTERFTLSESTAKQQHIPGSVVFLRKFLLGNSVRKLHTTLQGESLLQSADRAGVTIPRSCCVGSCGTCKVRVVAGKVVMDEPNNLGSEDLARGFVLACVAYPQTDVVVKLKPGALF